MKLKELHWSEFPIGIQWILRREQTRLDEFNPMLHLHCVLEANICSCVVCGSGTVPARSIIHCVWMKGSLPNYIFNLLALVLLDCSKEM